MDEETPQEQVSVDELLPSAETPAVPVEEAQFQAVLEAIIYVAEEPITVDQLASALQQPAERIQGVLDGLIAEFEKPAHGVAIREVAGGYKMATKPEHHEAVRAFAKSLKPPLKLSLPALETLAVIAYKQPVTGPEIQAIRGVQGSGVLKTLLDRKLIAVAGRKAVIGKPMMYKTTKDFLIQFGLRDLSELPSLKEFEEIRRMALSDEGPGTEQGAVDKARQSASGPGAGEASAAVESQSVPAAPVEIADEPAAPVETSPETTEPEQ
jgi:segregation and condensation protein B